MVRVTILCVLTLGLSAGQKPGASADAFQRIQALAGDWDANLPGFGKLTTSIRLVSNGKAIEETLGTPSDNEVAIYTRDANRILLTHFCAMTPEGHTVRLETAPVADDANRMLFTLKDAVNLPGEAAPHMRQVVMTLTDPTHFSEKWTKSENGKDTIFDLNFVRR